VEFELCRIEGSVRCRWEGCRSGWRSSKGRGDHHHLHKGGRSLQGARFLKASGFTNARSLTGGVDAWAANVDKGMTRY